MNGNNTNPTALAGDVHDSLRHVAALASAACDMRPHVHETVPYDELVIAPERIMELLDRYDHAPDAIDRLVTGDELEAFIEHTADDLSTAGPIVAQVISGDAPDAREQIAHRFTVAFEALQGMREALVAEMRSRFLPQLMR